MQTALKLLARRAHFEKELKEKLVRKELDTKEIEEAMRWCRERGYLDDIEVAAQWIKEQVRKGHGPRLLWAKLKTKCDLSDEVLWELLGKIDQEAAIYRLLERRYAGKEREKVMAALQRRGFDLEVITQTLL